MAGVRGQVIYRAPGSLFETRATVTPGGDYLLTFPTDSAGHDPAEGHCHYGRADRKVNDLVAFRSSDGGESWHGPRVAFAIDYNQHGFVPFIPRGGSLLHAFGTQPIWDRYRRDRGRRENAPIGYRRSHDDGHTWGDVRLIEPDDDAGFTGMSVMRMCETEAGSWLIGSHEADWSHRPLQTRQYVLRSEDEGALPGFGCPKAARRRMTGLLRAFAPVLDRITVPSATRARAPLPAFRSPVMK